MKKFVCDCVCLFPFIGCTALDETWYDASGAAGG